MSLRILEYTVGVDYISPAAIQKGGVQNDHLATSLKFVLDNPLRTKLSELGSGGTLYYRFDGYDGAGGKSSTVPQELNLSETEALIYPIESRLTQYGGTIRVFLVITLVKDDKTEMEAYSYEVKLILKSLPEAGDVSGETPESITTLAVSAKENAEIAENAAKVAEEARGKTENAKAALEGGTEWIFDGGNAEGEISIDFAVDAEVTESSANPVQSKGIFAYIAAELEKLTAETEAKIAEAKAEAKKDALDEAHPIGSVYYSFEATSPADLFGGTWEQIKDTFILAVGDIYPIGNSGGAATVKLTVDNLPPHSHIVPTSVGADGEGDKDYFSLIQPTSSRNDTSTTGEIGNGEAFSIMPPYITAYCWKRTA
ncbi:MAG: hypothetical protein IKD04_02285 [Clostridia bacterium]|nr:hypothetical protein [Clostridia bacterium]